jgi:organic hydroperoxide reductase OsmC/OhrA
MDEDLFNMELRKFLKTVGVTSQREIEQAVRQGLENGTVKGGDKVKVKATISIAGLDLNHEIDGTISIG